MSCFGRPYEGSLTALHEALRRQRFDAWRLNYAYTYSFDLSDHRLTADDYSTLQIGAVKFNLLATCHRWLSSGANALLQRTWGLYFLPLKCLSLLLLSVLLLSFDGDNPSSHDGFNFVVICCCARYRHIAIIMAICTHILCRNNILVFHEDERTFRISYKHIIQTHHTGRLYKHIVQTHHTNIYHKHRTNISCKNIIQT